MAVAAHAVEGDAGFGRFGRVAFFFGDALDGGAFFFGGGEDLLGVGDEVRPGGAVFAVVPVVGVALGFVRCSFVL